LTDVGLAVLMSGRFDVLDEVIQENAVILSASEGSTVGHRRSFGSASG
jgi:hypothetical protein